MDNTEDIVGRCDAPIRATDVTVDQFMHSIFEPCDRVVICHKDTLDPDAPKWSDTSYTLEDAVAYLVANPDTPNLYFRASSHDGSTAYTGSNCIRTHALFLDIDCGEAGHKQESKFGTLDDVLAYLLTMPLKPSIAWHTGHGVQCAYLLDKPYEHLEDNGPALPSFTEVSRGLTAMAMGDATFTPEHAFRIPLTINSKSHHDPSLPDVRGEFIWFLPHQKYSFEQIADAVKHYGIDDLIKGKPVKRGDVSYAYSELPDDLRNLIEGGGERSERLFGIIGWMVRLGYDKDNIYNAVSHGDDFVEKYDKRSGGLYGEVERCVDKITEGRYVYRAKNVPPVEIYNLPAPVSLDQCTGLPDKLKTMLDRYATATGANLLLRVYDAARFHEHLHATRNSGVIESPCGAGKSVWALSHIALHASDTNRYIYVVETVDTLYRVSKLLEKLTEVPVGRVHGFSQQRCEKLSGKTYTWKQCLLNKTSAPCNYCKAKDTCAYFTRKEQEKQNILVMTHSGIIRLIESESALLKDSHIIIDEGLTPFATWSATHGELRALKNAHGVPSSLLTTLFPGTHIASESILRSYKIPVTTPTYARRNYVFQGKAYAESIKPVIKELRAILVKGTFKYPFKHSSTIEEIRDIEETISGIINFFRPGTRGDTTYSYHESDDGVGAKRSCFDLGTGGAWQSLWMLNASAQLSPQPYPDNMTVYTCSDLKGNSHLVNLHILRSNLTQTKAESAIELGAVPMTYGVVGKQHQRILVCINKDSPYENTIKDQITKVFGETAEVEVLSRGRIKGVNSAGECTLILLQGMSTFTGLADAALHAALHYKRSFPRVPYVFNKNGAPHWPGGQMSVPAMRTYYTLLSLDEIYQAIWRTAVRNDKPVEAIIALPEPGWLSALYRTVMPRTRVTSAYRASSGTLQDDDPACQYDWVEDTQMRGMDICAVEPGTTITKNNAAIALGYKGDNPATAKRPKGAWERNRDTLRNLLDGIFREKGKSELERV